MSIVFQTEGGLQGQPRDRWEDMMFRHHVPVSSELHGDGNGAFTGSMRLDNWGRLQLSMFSFSASAYHRGPREIRQSPQDDFLCSLVRRGTGVLDAGGVQTEFGPGDVVLYDSGRIYSVHYFDTADVVTLRIPRALIVSRFPGAESRPPLRFSENRPMGRLAAGTLRSLISFDALTDDAHSRESEAPVLDLICLAARDVNGDDERPSPGHELLLSRIKRDIRENLDDTTLSVATIAEAHGISPRTLGRLFASEGTTVMRWIWSQRLCESYRALSGGSVRQVTEAAFTFGFKDSTHFSRAFKKQFKISPSELLNR